MTRDRAYYLKRAALHQRLSALRHRHIQETIAYIGMPGVGAYHYKTRFDRLFNERQMHAELASDYLTAAMLIGDRVHVSPDC